MGKVHLLDSITANQIAAGEVVERPASVVKELVENSIDAGATRIDIDIRGGGKELIRVVDNGSGMDSEDAALCVKRHATSKIANVSDLVSIGSLGFRGEAIPSIASISRFELRTSASDSESGTQIVVEGGNMVCSGPVGSPRGTSIWVRDLFFNTPVRYKFLKTNATETRTIIDVTGFLSLAHPHIAFSLSVDGKQVLATTGGGNLLDVISAVLGRDISRNLIPLNLDDGHFRLNGYTSSPTLARANRSHELFFINGRYIKNRTLSAALEKAYERIIPSGRFPAAVVKIEMDASAVDVNVHPTKMEVRFEDDSEMYRVMYRASSRALSSTSHCTDEQAEGSALHVHVHVPKDTYQQAFSQQRTFMSAASSANYRYEPPPVLAPASAPALGNPTGPCVLRQEAAETPAEFDDPAHLDILGQVLNTYIVCADLEGITIVDQHNSHERLIYDSMKSALSRSRTSGFPVSQQMLIPDTICTSQSELSLIVDNLDTLSNLGYTLDIRPDGQITVNAVPVDLAGTVDVHMLMDVVQELAAQESAASVELSAEATSTPIPDIAKRREDQLLVNLACKAAMKAGKTLDPNEMQSLIKALLKAETPFTCPHGRPTLIRLNREELERRLGRR